MGAHILVAEDNAPSRELVTYLLRSHGHTVHAMATGSLALRAARTLRADLILIDLQLPDLDGYQLLHHLRAGTRNAGTPMVAVTAVAMVGERERALRAGFDHYLAKPINPRTFPDDVRGWLGHPDLVRSPTT